MTRPLLDDLRCTRPGCGRPVSEHTIPLGPDAGDLIRLPGVDYDAPERQVGVEARFPGVEFRGLYCPPELRYAVTCSGECPACGVTVTVTGHGAERLPDAALGAATADPLACLCGATVPAVWVGFTLAGYTTTLDDGVDVDELDEDTARIAGYLADTVEPLEPGAEWPAVR